MDILIGGDFAPNLRVKKAIESEKFDFISEIRAESKKVDFTIINLESPIVETDDCPIVKVGPNLSCTAKTIDVLKYANINVLTLANNHILDYGERALKRTIDLCHKAGIKTVGAGNNLKEAEKILYLSKDDIKVSIINCCEHEYSIAQDNSAGCNPINPIKQYYKIQEAKHNSDFVIVIVHGGHERFQLPSLRMQETYRFFIDSGADVVINHHQHCFSGYEKYNSNLIFYGIGNLNFDTDKPEAETWHQGFMIKLHINKQINFEILPFEQCTSNSINTHFLNSDIYNPQLRELNKIIENPSLLSERVQEYYRKELPYIESIFDFYSNKWLKAFRKRNLLPTLLLKRKKGQIQNAIFCESHFDKVKYFFSGKEK